MKPEARWVRALALKAKGRQTRRISTMPNKVVFSGIQPTGVPHIGNYLGAIRQWVQLQEEPGTTALFSVVDLHALTSLVPKADLRLRKRETLAALLAAGISPEKSTLFYQSSVSPGRGACCCHATLLICRQVPAHVELMWILSCTASVGYLSRMTQWKVGV
jgi:tryptophanyl-tRNA synthetase